MKSSSRPLQPTGQPHQLRQCLPCRHYSCRYSLNTEQSYPHWVHIFVRWSGRSGRRMHHLKHMAATKAQAEAQAEAQVAALLAQLQGMEPLLDALAEPVGPQPHGMANAEKWGAAPKFC